MSKIRGLINYEPSLLVGVGFLILLSIITLRATASFLFPAYFFYLALAILAFFFFSKIDFEIISLFSKHLYLVSIVFLILPLLIGQVTRGAIRWIPLGPLNIQPDEVVRPILLVYIENKINEYEKEGFETILSEEDEKFRVFTRRVVKEIKVECASN